MTRRAAVEKHYASLWGRADLEMRLRKGPLVDVPDPVWVLGFSRPGGTAAFATVGFSKADDAEPIELFLVMPGHEHAYSATELLTAVAYFHRTGARVDVDHTVNFGRPVAHGSQCSFGLLSYPHFQGEEFASCGPTRVIWVIPITPSEVQFKMRHGIEALEERFADREVEYWDLDRDPVV